MAAKALKPFSKKEPHNSRENSSFFYRSSLLSRVNDWSGLNDLNVWNSF
jgi:hypothetical protein